MTRLKARVTDWLEGITDGEPVAPLLVLFAINAIDEMDRSAFNILTPEIRDAFHLRTGGILSVIALVTIVATGGQAFIGYYADRFPRLRIAFGGATVWGFFSLLTGLSPVLAVLIVSRSLTGVGRAVNDPTHNSLLADYYAPSARTKVYGFHRASVGVGVVLGSLLAGLLARQFGWRAPFIIFWIPMALILVFAIRKLREPVRGAHERRAMGASEETALTEEDPPTFGEAWRICRQVRTLRRIWWSLPFVAAGLFGMGSLTAIYYRDVFGVNEVQRGFIAAAAEPAQLLGIAIGIPIATRLARKDPGLVLKFLAVAATISAVAMVGFTTAATLPTAIVMNVIFAAVLGMIGPGILSSLSLAIPPRARAIGFSIGSLYLLPGIFVLIVIGGIADSTGIRHALLILVPVFLLGAYILASAGSFVAPDIERVRASTLAQAEVLASRRRGDIKLLLVKDLDVAYDDVQVLFGVNFDVDEGEIIALLGTNGAGKSTLLKAISGHLEAQAGAIVFDGRDTTLAPPHEQAARGIVLMPGGRGIFPGLSVDEHLRLAGWLYQKDEAYLTAATKRVLELFPVLPGILSAPAATLSGGQQQMLSLAMSFIARPKLLMIDELSLGLAPAVVEQLLEVVRELRKAGTTIILVEQSVNVALTVADTAYFMEKGEIRFHGPTRELLARPDLLRSVFLEGAATRTATKRRSIRAKVAPGVGGNGKRPVVLETRNLTKSFGGVRAVDDLSITLHEGEILGIIGPNGAGKTTLFDIISGFLTPDEGSIFLDGQEITQLRPDTRSILGLARSFQDARLFGALTAHQSIGVALDRELAVRDPVAAALGLRDVAESERELSDKVDELIERMGITAFRDKFSYELSTGSRRVVDLACQVGVKPKVILFDEPSSGIAQRETEALGPLLRRISEETGASLVVIEHDMPLISGISDRIVALDLGRALVDGPPATVLRHPQVVSSYLGTNQEVIRRSGLAKPATKRGSRAGRRPSGPK